ncbi:hypothetical protein [Paludisphaera borealis]|uniref:Uncharacterized protein n=1 Tax=Paludisphaera borealis TaxID=1387353 RepID=A0A1U7CL94_9BACT|nr:hypothetical protein [Paludisphaera borealis]APW59678.1 hypothetical protein BSF38_01107 [Paludisphaera borealis]
MSRHVVRIVLLLVAATVGTGNREASAGFLIGSTFHVVGTNTPTTFTQDVVLSVGTTLIDGDRLTLTQSFFHIGNSDWLNLRFEATQGLLSTNRNIPWGMNVSNVQLTTPELYSAKMAYWTIAGEPAEPIYPFGQFRPILPNPLDPEGRNVYLAYLQGTNLVTSLTQNAGPFTPSYSNILDGGMDPGKVTGFNMAFQITPAVPEPSSVVSGVMGGVILALVKLRRSRAAGARVLGRNRI